MRKKTLLLLSLIACALLALASMLACTPLDEEANLVGLAITTAPTKTAYMEGETFDPTGMVVEAQYDDDTSEPITDYTWSPAGALELNDTYVIISWHGVTVKQSIIVSPYVAPEAESIAITSQPQKLKYFWGDTLDLTGLVVTATYEGGTTAPVEDYHVNFRVLDASAREFANGDQLRIVVTYQGFTADFTITVTDPALSALEITKQPDRLLYDEGETFDPTGMVVVARYENDTTKTLKASEYTYAPKTALTTADREITVSYTEDGVTKTAPVAITVAALELTGIRVEVEPTYTIYGEGDLFNSAGLVIYGIYNNDPELAREITGWEVENADKPLTAADTSVTVRYGEFTTTVSIAVYPEYRFEAEALGYEAKTDGTALNLRRGMEYGDTTYGSNSTNVFWSDVSGTGRLSNYSTVATLLLNVYVEKATDVSVIIRVASHHADVGGTQAITNIFNGIEVGGVTYEIDPDAQTVRHAGSIRYQDWQRVAIASSIPLKAGENTLRFLVKGNYDLDYIALRSAEPVELTAERGVGHNWSEWLVTAAPTATVEGEMYRYCPICYSREVVTLPTTLTATKSVAATAYTAGYDEYTYEGNTFKIYTEEAYGAKVDNVRDLDNMTLDPTYCERTGARPTIVDKSGDYHGTGDYAWNSYGGSWSLTFYSNVEATVNMWLRIARNNTRHLNAAFQTRVFVNDKPITLDPNHPETHASDHGGAAWGDWVYVPLAIFNVQKGANKIVVEAIGGQFTNVDDFKLVAATELVDSEDELVTKVDLTKPATNLSYNAGERFNAAGMVLTATLKNGKTRAVTTYGVEPHGPIPGGTTEVTIHAEGFAIKQAITVKDTVLDSIEVTHGPDAYFVEGDEFDPEGMVVVAHYQDGSQSTLSIDDLEIVSETLHGGTNTVTVKFQNKSVEYTVTAAFRNLFEAESFDIGTYSRAIYKQFETSVALSKINGIGYLANFLTSGSAEKIDLTFKVWAPAATEARIAFILGSRDASTVSTRFPDFTVNGKKVTPDATPIGNSGYTEFVETGMAATFQLEQGENTIVLNCWLYATNFDSVVLYAPVQLTAPECKDGHAWSEWNLLKQPTATADGDLYRVCGGCLRSEYIALPASVLSGQPDSTTEATATAKGTATYTYNGKSFTIYTDAATGEKKETIFKLEHAEVVAQAEGFAATPASTFVDRTAQTNGSGGYWMECNGRSGQAIFHITAEQAGTARFGYEIAASNAVVNVAGLFQVTVNGKGVALNYGTTLAANNKNTSGMDNWWAVNKVYVAEFELVAGENTIVVSDTGIVGTNWRGILIETAADVHWSYNTLTANTETVKTSYTAGETFDAANLEITASRVVDNSKVAGWGSLTETAVDAKVVTGWTVVNAEKQLTVDDTFVTVQYGTLTVQIPITVA